MKPGRGEGRVLVLSLYCTPPQRRYLVQFIHQVGAVHPVRWELRPAPGRRHQALTSNEAGPSRATVKGLYPVLRHPAPSGGGSRPLHSPRCRPCPRLSRNTGSRLVGIPRRRPFMRMWQQLDFLALLDTLASLLLAFVLGSLVGLERQYRQRTAGLRTNVLVAVGGGPVRQPGPAHL